MPGTIERVECDPYNYTVPETGEVVTLAHTYEYVPGTVLTLNGTKTKTGSSLSSAS
jgi:hypothetical protein